MTLINWLDLEPGSQADWASAFGSVLAAVVAVGIAVAGSRGQKKREREATVRAVVVYVTQTSDDGKFKVWNGGALPIFDVRAYATVERGDGPEEHAQLEGAIAAQQGKEIDVGRETAAHTDQPLRITFRDANDRLWTKWVGGKFEQCKKK